MLNIIDHGIDHGGDLPPLLIAHGLFGSARNWGVIAKRLSDIRRVIAVDMRNHGDSPHDPDHGYAALAEDLAEVIGALGGAADVLGHSMGGKAAMVLALTRPEAVGHLIIADIAPVAYGHTQMPMIDAMRGVPLAGLERRSEADPHLANSIPEAPLRAFLLQSLDVGETGARWKLNLDALAANMDAIIGFPEIEGQFDGPVDVIAGATSDYVDDAGRDAISGHFPQASFHEVADAGHWVHAENPRGFEAAVRDVLV